MEYDELIQEESTTNGHHPPANPWMHIWTRTTDALHHVFMYQREFFIHRHFMLLGLMFLLAMRLPDWLAAKPDPIGVMIQVLLAGPIGGIVLGYIYASFSRNIGKRFGGLAVQKDVMRAAIAWTNYPIAVAWLVFFSIYAILHQVQPEAVQTRIWLFEGLLGWIPVIAGGLLLAWAFWLRLKAVAFALQLSMGAAVVVWLLTLIFMYLPLGLIGTAYYTIFRTTISVAQQAGG